jgi:hypothetical protein
MAEITRGEWVVDLDAMTCRNNTNKIIVSFEKQGKAIFSKIDYIPLYTLRRWALAQDGSNNIRKIIAEAEDIFLIVYFENMLCE